MCVCVCVCVCVCARVCACMCVYDLHIEVPNELDDSLEIFSFHFSDIVSLPRHDEVTPAIACFGWYCHGRRFIEI